MFNKLRLTVGAILLSILASVGSAFATSLPLNCPMFAPVLSSVTPRLLNSDYGVGNLIFELFDTNGDRVPDIAVYSPGIGGYDENGNLAHGKPLFYEVDINNDGAPDELYIDQFGDGNCNEIHSYGAPFTKTREKRQQGLVAWNYVRPDLRYDGRPVPVEEEAPQLVAEGIIIKPKECELCDVSIYEFQLWVKKGR